MAAKINKKELEEPDKLQLLFLTIRSFAEKNKTRIYAGGVLFILILGIAGGWYLYQFNYETNASKVYARVFENAMKTGSPAGDAAAIKGYKDLIEQYPRSGSATRASLRLGNLYFNQHDVDAAINYYENFLKRTSVDNDIISLAYNSLGSCYELKKNYTKALEFYEKASTINTTSSFEMINLSGMARVYEAMNNHLKAVEYYKKALEKTTEPLMTLYLKRKISDLG